jgi:hypothetical protein
VKEETHVSLQVSQAPKVLMQAAVPFPCIVHNLAVHCIDASEVGVAKTLKLASERGVVVHASQGLGSSNRFTSFPEMLLGFLEDLNLEPNSIDTFVSVFCHTLPVSSLHASHCDADSQYRNFAAVFIEWLRKPFDQEACSFLRLTRQSKLHLEQVAPSWKL